MKKKHLLSLTAMAVVSLGLFGCSTEKSSEEKEVTLVETKEAEAEKPVAESKESKEEPKVESAIGKRSNPVPIGETIQFPVEYSNEDWTETFNGKATMSISNIVRGQEALDTLMAENEYNETPPEGYEWMIFTVSMGLVEGDIDNPYMPMDMFSIIDTSGSEVPQDIYPTFDGNDFGYTAIFPDGNASGRVAKVVKSGEDPLIVYSEGFSNSYYFATN